MTNPTTPPEPAPDRPLAVGMLLGLSGWAAGIFIWMFVWTLVRPESAAQAASSGAFLLAAAWGLFNIDRDRGQVFVAQLGLALSIAGQCLVLFALARQLQGVAATAGAALLLQGVLAATVPNRVHRTLSALFATVAWALALRFSFFGEAGGWRQPGAAPLPASWPAALAVWLLTWVPPAGLVAWAIRREAVWVARGWAPAIRPVVTGLIVGLAFATFASEPFDALRGADAGGLALWPLLSALGAVVALAAAFAQRRRGLIALCIGAALLHIGHFYWALGTSLRVKSLWMLAIGGLFLAASRLLLREKTA